MKVFIMTDLEGVSGINGRKADEVGNKIINTDVACRLLTEEVNACVEGLVAEGAEKIIVTDGHGGSNSILIEHLHAKAELMNYAYGIIPVSLGRDKSFDAAIHIGTHAMMGVADGFLNHTYNSHGVVNMWLNGNLIGEIGIEALIAAYFSIPTILVSGDKAACREAVDFLGQVETVETKTGISRYSVINRSPEEARTELKLKSQKALKKLKTFKAKTIPSPFKLQIELMCPNMADEYERKGALRVNHNTIILQSDDFLDVWAQRNGWGTGVHNKRFNISQGIKK